MSGSEPSGSKPPSEAPLHFGELVDSHAGTEAPGTTQFIRRAVAETSAKKERQIVVPQEVGKLSPELLLAVVTYCYAKGVYGCAEIEEAILSDKDLRAKFGNDLPDDRSLRRFRRLNREAIKATLERAFIEAKHTLGSIPPDRLQAACRQNQSQEGSAATPTGESEATSFLVKKAVEDRIQKALFIDGMSKDY